MNIKEKVVFVGLDASKATLATLDLSRFSAAPGSQLSSHTLENQWAFPS